MMINNNLKNLLIISLNFFLVYVAFNSSQNMVSTIYSYKYGNLGTISVCLIYIGFAFNNVFVNNYIHKW